MKRVTQFWIRGLTLCCLAMTGPAQAQPVPDASLGANGSVVTPNVPIKGLPSDQIKGGATRGANLFHSFQEFNVKEGRGVYFTNPVGIENILTRVTGSNPSKILGTLGVWDSANNKLGNANLFLLNPNGVIFGPNASLDVGGSVLASTASSLTFEDGTQFSATASQTKPLLTVHAPIGLQFEANAGDIPVQGSGLAVPLGKTLALVGGKVSLMDGASLQASGGRVELGGVAEAGTVGLNGSGGDLSLSFPQGVQRADVSLTNGATVGVTAKDGGSIAINAQNIDILGGSRLSAGIASGGSVNNQAEDITLNATEAITVAGSDILNTVAPKALGKGGDIEIQAKSFSLANGTTLNITTFGQGDAGSISVRASDSVSLTGNSLISAESKATGNGGSIDITTVSLSMKDGAQLYADTYRQGNAGNMTINAKTVSLEGDDMGSDDDFSGVGVFSRVFRKKATGNAGNINITTDFLSLTNGARLNVSTRGKGDAGDVTINAKTVSLDGVGGKVSSAINSRVTKAADDGNAGSINITTESLLVTDGARIANTTLGKGNAGNVTIKAETVSLKGVGSNGESSGIRSFVGSEAEGNGGIVDITTGSLLVTDGALVTALTDSQGSGGNITINAKTLKAHNGGQVTTTTRGPGEAGNINLNVTDSVTLAGHDPTYSDRSDEFGPKIVLNAGPNSGLFADTTKSSIADPSKPSTGRGGSLRVTTGQLLIQDEAEVSVSSTGLGNGGSLGVEADSIFLDKGKLTAKTPSGEGGNIVLQAQNVRLRDESEISTSAGSKDSSGNGGNIVIDTNTLSGEGNSNITANSVGGKGGLVLITAQEEIKGLEEDPPQLSITADSNLGPEFDGIVEINTPDVSGLVALPEEVVDVTGLIAQGCAASGSSAGQEKGEFYITGRGGLPPTPRETINSDTILEDWGTKDGSDPLSTTPSKDSPTALANPLPAKGWVINDKGEVALTAQVPTPTACHAR